MKFNSWVVAGDGGAAWVCGLDIVQRPGECLLSRGPAIQYQVWCHPGASLAPPPQTGNVRLHRELHTEWILIGAGVGGAQFHFKPLTCLLPWALETHWGHMEIGVNKAYLGNVILGPIDACLKPPSQSETSRGHVVNVCLAKVLSLNPE